MLLNEIEKLRKQLNKQAENLSLNSDDVIKTSQRLDELIVAYYKTQCTNTVKCNNN